MRLCRHQPHKVIDWIKDPKWLTKEIRIDESAISPNIEHYIIRFANTKAIPQFNDKSAQEEYGWFYMGGNTIRRHKTVKNGAINVYLVPLSKRQEFEPIKHCEHDL